MKTHELIRRLQEADPSGDLEVAVGNADILFVSREPAYYDGDLQVLVRDPAQAPFYNVVGAKVVRSGDKVQVHALSIADALMNDPDLPVEYIGEGPAQHSRRAYDHLRAGFKRDLDESGYLKAGQALAAELLGLGSGCYDGGCELAGMGTRAGGQCTNGGCTCLAYDGSGKRRGFVEKMALRAAVKAAGAVLEEHL